VAPGLRLEAHIGGGAIQALGLVAIGPAPARSPQTARGIALGAPVASVEERYGRPGTAGLWYASEGIAFNVAGPSATVQSILVVPRGRPRRSRNMARRPAGAPARNEVPRSD
jgi:hypothetical protein